MKLATVFVAAVLFAGAIVVARAALDVALSHPPAPVFLRVVEDGAGGIVCNRVSKGPCTMRQSYARAAARRETTEQFNARMAARTAPVKPWGKILSAEEIEASRADERAAMNIDQFTQAEQMALMQASHEHRHQHIWHRLRRNFEVPPFTLSTFRSLAERGLTEKPEGKTFHTLTAEGARIADSVADALVEEHDLHLAWLSSAARWRSRNGPRIHQRTLRCGRCRDQRLHLRRVARCPVRDLMAEQH